MKLSPYGIKDFKALLTIAFRALRKAGYYAKRDYWCCQTCAWNDVPDGQDKVVFYHRQDADHIPDGYVYMAWSGDGVKIASIFRDAGLRVEWDGTSDTRILVKYIG